MNKKKKIDTSATGADQSRRRLTKAALTLPIVASVAPRAAFGCSVSGFLSGNVSENHEPYTCEGNGCTPGFWKNNIEAWPLGISPGSCGIFHPSNGKCTQWDASVSPGGATAISSIAPTSCFIEFSDFITGYGYSDNSSLMDILLKEVSNGGNTNSILAHYIAAILNATVSPVAYRSSMQDIQDGFCKALDENRLEEFKDILDFLNNRGCFLDAHGDCEKGFVLYDGACIPTDTCTATDSAGECISIETSTP